MAIKYKIIQKAQPGIAGGGDKKFYAATLLTGEKTLAGLTKEIGKISTVSGADIRAVLYALVDVMQTALAEGRLYVWAELGSLRVSISSEGKNTEKEVTVATIKKAKILFTPGKELKNMLLTLSYQKQ